MNMDLEIQMIQISSQSPPNSEALLPDTLSPECSSLMLLEKNNLRHKATTQSKDEPLIIQPRIQRKHHQSGWGRRIN